MGLFMIILSEKDTMSKIMLSNIRRLLLLCGKNGIFEKTSAEVAKTQNGELEGPMNKESAS